MIGTALAPDWLQPDWVLGQFDPQRERAREKYVDFVRTGAGLPSLWNDLRQQIFLGSEAFVTRMQAEVSQEQPLDEIPRMQRRAIAKPLTGYRLEHEGDARRGMALAYLTGDYTMKAIAAEFGIHYTTVSRAIKEYESKESR